MQIVVTDVNQVDILLGKTSNIFIAFKWQLHRFIESDNPWIISLDPINRTCAKAKNQSQHTGFRVHMLVPDKGIIRNADTGQFREVIIFMVRAGNALNKQAHLLHLLIKTALLAIGQGVFAHGAGENFANGIFKSIVSIFRRALVGTKETVIFAGKSVAKAVFQQ